MNRPTNRLFAYSGIAALLPFLMVVPSWCQKSGSPGQGPSRPSGPTGGSAPNPPGHPSPMGQSGPQLRTPLYVNGRVLLVDTNQPSPEPVSVQLNCGPNLLQVIQTDLKGYFQFVLGAGPQSNANLSAADSTPIGMVGMSGALSSSSYGRIGNGLGDLTGCELRVMVDGYRPASHVISGPPELGTMDVGTMRLTRIAGVPGSAISVTSLLVPSSARKEFEKGDKDVRDNKLKSATEHLQKAVAEYDNYAAAWNELGGIYATTHDTEKARQAFTKAIAVDPKYIPPYVNLSGLQLQNQEYQEAVGTAGRALELDPAIPLANYLNAVGNYKLKRLDDAEKSAQQVEKGPHQNLPQVYGLLADIYMLKEDYPKAAEQMRTYLKQWPRGPFAANMKKSLDQIEASGTKSSPAQPQSAP